MLIRTMQEFESQGRIVSISHGKSTAIRLLTKADGLGFSISEARAEKAGQAALWYKHHWEANYVRAGRATLEDRTTGQRWTLERESALPEAAPAPLCRTAHQIGPERIALHVTHQRE